jgi:uncharacterized membrane protein YcfT
MAALARARPASTDAARASIEPGRFAVARAFLVVVAERLFAKSAPRRPAPRDAVVDTAKGLALILTLLVQFSYESARHGAPGFAPVYAVLNLLALPAFMVTAGFFLQKTIKLRWMDYAPRKTAVFCLAIAGWALVEIVLAWLAAPRGTMPLSLAWRSLGVVTEQVPLLVIVPAFLLLARYFRAHVALVMIIAIIAELLVMPGRTFGGECMRGLIYFYVGFRFSSQFNRLAREARADPPMALSAIAVWVAIAALCAFVPIPQAHGATISTMPFATLGLGLAGAAVAFMAAALLAHHKIWVGLATIGRNWIAVALAVPLGLMALRLALIATRTASDAGRADLIIGVAALAGFLALVGVTIVQNWPHRAKAQVKPRTALRVG